MGVYTFDSYEGVIVLSQARLCKVITEEKRIIERKMFFKKRKWNVKPYLLLHIK